MGETDSKQSLYKPGVIDEYDNIGNFLKKDRNFDTIKISEANLNNIANIRLTNIDDFPTFNYTDSVVNNVHNSERKDIINLIGSNLANTPKPALYPGSFYNASAPLIDWGIFNDNLDSNKRNELLSFQSLWKQKGIYKTFTPPINNPQNVNLYNPFTKNDYDDDHSPIIQSHKDNNICSKENQRHCPVISKLPSGNCLFDSLFLEERISGGEMHFGYNPNPIFYDEPDIDYGWKPNLGYNIENSNSIKITNGNNEEEIEAYFLNVEPSWSNTAWIGQGPERDVTCLTPTGGSDYAECELNKNLDINSCRPNLIANPEPMKYILDYDTPPMKYILEHIPYIEMIPKRWTGVVVGDNPNLQNWGTKVNSLKCNMHNPRGCKDGTSTMLCSLNDQMDVYSCPGAYNPYYDDIPHFTSDPYVVPIEDYFGTGASLKNGIIDKNSTKRGLGICAYPKNIIKDRDDAYTLYKLVRDNKMPIELGDKLMNNYCTRTLPHPDPSVDLKPTGDLVVECVKRDNQGNLTNEKCYERNDCYNKNSGKPCNYLDTYYRCGKWNIAGIEHPITLCSQEAYDRTHPVVDHPEGDAYNNICNHYFENTGNRSKDEIKRLYNDRWKEWCGKDENKLSPLCDCINAFDDRDKLPHREFQKRRYDKIKSMDLLLNTDDNNQSGVAELPPECTLLTPCRTNEYQYHVDCGDITICNQFIKADNTNINESNIINQCTQNIEKKETYAGGFPSYSLPSSDANYVPTNEPMPPSLYSDINDGFNIPVEDFDIKEVYGTSDETKINEPIIVNTTTKDKDDNNKYYTIGGLILLIFIILVITISMLVSSSSGITVYKNYYKR